LVWWGMESPSVYPEGASAEFSLATDSSVEPGTVSAMAATYTPQYNPHYYQPWQGAVTGPSVVAATGSPPANKFANLQTSSVFATNNYPSISANQAGTVLPEPVIAGNLHAGVTIEGLVGRAYRIEYTDDLGNLAAWRPLASVTLSAPKQTWYDPEPAAQSQRYYRVVLERTP